MALIVSNTRINSKNTCDKQHDYMYNQELEPRQYSLAIRRGIAGHAVLETYYKCRQDGWDHDAAIDHAIDTLFKIISESDPDDIEHTKMLTHLHKLLRQYFDYYSTDQFRVVSVETLYTAPMIGEIHFGMFLDLLVEYTTGEFRGSYGIIDHKFVNNFMTPEELFLNGQQPKYMKVAQLNDIPVRQAIFNQIRYRSMKDPKPTDLFRRSPLLGTRQSVETVWEDTAKVAWKIYAEESVPTRNPQRVLTYSACKYCFFRKLCIAELNGEDTELMRRIDYKHRESPLKDWMLSNA